MIPFSITDTVVAVGIISSELHKLPSDAWTTKSQLIRTDAFANSAFSKSPSSVELFEKGVEELDKRNIIRRHARDWTLLQWKRPNYKKQFALCKDDTGVNDVLVRANAMLMAQIEVEVRKAADEAKKAAAESAIADSALKKAAAESAMADADSAEAEARRQAALSKLKKPEPL